ncbi:hypothetical protein Emtol_0336 (plasmid) [Emticicia oligotrophica DSM 17448]|uniref:Uncharacterized protein n=1 Tax=Emticicia oligotrophica (strain DSM 17448 / CIP 109782 / MTCC 6937 / GPTSA100-15) TaxID=929562 RepID=A0ABM5N7Y9_EMTOG|nr:hypothetical protein [Emticicia oligotrophica]AFK05603.1 hypothetical protein Emtol_0336 [Emticicia oligotrophica DSM 17448]
MNQHKELQSFFEEFGYQIYENISPNSNGDKLKRNILLNRFLNPDNATFMPFVVNNIEQLATYFQNEYSQKGPQKPELTLNQKIDAQLRELRIHLSETEIHHLLNDKKVVTKLALKKQNEQAQSQYNSIEIKLNPKTEDSTLSIRFRQPKIIIPKEIAQKISKNDRKMIALLIQSNQSFTFNLTDTILRIVPAEKTKKEVQAPQMQNSIFSDLKQLKFKM